MAVESPAVMHTAPVLSKESALAFEVKKTGTAVGTGRGARKASYEESEVDPLASLHAATRNSDNNRGKRMEKRQRGDAVAGGGGNGATGNEPDEKYYFGQYVGYYNLLCEDVAQRSLAAPKPAKGGKRKAADEVPTDDVCFLCKDGGDLIECDWRCPSAKSGERCLKVYHAYCLDYEVADDNWVCPRHYCDMCGSKTLKYICKYCPVSICANCPEKIVSKYGHARYCEVKDALSGPWRHTPTAPGVQSIVCHTCTEMLEVISSTAVDNIKVSSNSSAGLQGSTSVDIMLADLRVQKRFPGVYEGESSGGGSVFRKDPGSTSDNLSSGDSFVYSKGKALPAKSKPKTAASVTSSTLSTAGGGGNNNNSNSKWSYRRWSDKETAVLRAAVRVHGDDAEAIKQDPKFAEALQFRHAEAIWNKILREALIPSEKNTPEASEMEEESDDDEEEEGNDSGEEEGEGEKSGDEEVVVKKEKNTGKFGKGKPAKGAAVVKEESSTETEDSQSSLFREEKIVVKVRESSEDTSTEESGAMDVDTASETPSVPVTINSIAPTEETEVPTEIDAAELPELAEVAKTSEDSTAQYDLAEGAAEEPAVVEGSQATLPSARSSSRMSADVSISTTDSKRGPGRGGRGRTRGGGGGRGGRWGRGGGRSSTNSPALSNPDGAPPSDGEHAGGDAEEGEEAQGADELPQMVATRGTRRQSEEKVLSTRSGKKLFLTGSDLLPTLH